MEIENDVHILRIIYIYNIYLFFPRILPDTPKRVAASFKGDKEGRFVCFLVYIFFFICKLLYNILYYNRLR